MAVCWLGGVIGRPWWQADVKEEMPRRNQGFMGVCPTHGSNVWAKAHTKGGRAMDDKGEKKGHQHLADSTIGKLMLEAE